MLATRASLRERLQRKSVVKLDEREAMTPLRLGRAVTVGSPTLPAGAFKLAAGRQRAKAVQAQ